MVTYGGMRSRTGIQTLYLRSHGYVVWIRIPWNCGKTVCLATMDYNVNENYPTYLMELIFVGILDMNYERI